MVLLRLTFFLPLLTLAVGCSDWRYGHDETACRNAEPPGGTHCEGDVIVSPNYVCDENAHQYVPDGTVTRIDCAASGKSCVEGDVYVASCEVLCSADGSCPSGQFCGERNVCQELGRQNSGCANDMQCQPGLRCFPSGSSGACGPATTYLPSLLPDGGVGFPPGILHDGG